MCHLGSGDGPHELEPVQVVAEPLEQPLPAPEQRRDEVDLHLVHRARRQILLRIPPIPRGLSTLWLGPATKPSSDIEILKRSFDMSGSLALGSWVI